MGKPIKFPATVDSVASRTDKTLSVRIRTQEIPGNVAGLLFGLQNAFVYVVIKEEDFGREELAEIEAMQADVMDDKRKTQSQRLRAVLYRNWEVDNKGCKTFALYYESEMERIVDHFKSKLP